LATGGSQTLLIAGIGAGVVVVVGVIALIVFLALGSRSQQTASPSPASGSPAANPPSAAAAPAPATSIAPAAPAAPAVVASSPATASPPAQPAAPIPSLANIDPDLRMKAEDLASEYKAGPAAADAKYAGKIIEVEGSVKVIGSHFKDRQPVATYVQVGNMDVLFQDVQCEMAGMDLPAQLSRKTKVKIKGRWRLPATGPDGKPQSIAFDKATIENCVFTEIGPSARVVVTAEEMSAQARADRVKFRALYDLYTDVLVTGEVGSIERDSASNVCLVFKTSAKPRIMISFGYTHDLEAKMKVKYPVGAKVSLAGIYNDATSASTPDIYLHGTLMVEK
jgi:hypothetical protein